MKSQASYPVIPVNQLKPGMYVIAIASQTGGMEIAQMGLVTSVSQIANLVRQGVLTVRIDLARSKLGSAESDAVTSPDLNANSAQVGRRASANGEGRELKIRRLYQEARELQGKFIRHLKAGEPIDITPLAEVAEEMVDTMFTHGDAMLCLARIRAKDAYLMEHSMNVAILLANFGRYLGLERSVLKELTLGGLLHDVGKIMTPDEVLHKPGKLTDEEFAIMRQHVVHSYEILSNTPGITPTMLEVAANHHERLDGSGYPQRLKGEQLSLYTRMSGIVDVYDAITADRVYKAGMQPTQAFRILLKGINQHFDAELVTKFIKCMGVYPVGTLVQLSNQRLAIVMQRNEQQPLKPVVKVIYHATQRHYLDVQWLDLAKSGVQESIENTVDPKEFGINLANFF
ncbi:HD-GYP domain-containing protein [Aeromonas veronii]|uniref:HD-GYP domain-containing protein n=1 Tax=Aeromonas TaxID=642 RepID=UPI00191E99C4|nr:HD-GYP domain-containing protein [Aeromonas veronii]MBL0463972.1 HD-GYP domain-containing protein [Aeromonas veronii]MBL0641601.1 HD-GYP domain-containing protein [Aeromonas veronii]MCF5873744.1 HD-GYP domain-containing protein [Aeromonas veronii]MCR3969644.1 HD-GYP domain-containing protein [Aeromonas veronii]MCR3974141.1 HD-GYP domain-containing protein [Aeromonas veronii]